MEKVKMYLLSEVHIATLMPFSLNLYLYVLEYETQQELDECLTVERVL